MNVEKEKIRITRKILAIESKDLLRQVEELLDQHHWQGVTDQEIAAIEEGLQDIEGGRTVSHADADLMIDKLFENYGKKNG
jgi:predicted transcriptional regulator